MTDESNIQHRLLAFYDEHRRALPWRQRPEPYAVWVSEVMLQQTRVETVVPYYERWLRQFPDIDALADAELDDVLKAWEGLGYYRRARHLHSAARMVRERHHGRLPDDPAALRELPGIGAYTAGAIASIAFGAPEPAVDGNVRRVLARLYDLASPTAAELRELAARLVPADRPGDFNQALMELGATVCTPRSPRCDACPVEAECRARALGVEEARPRPRKRAPIPEDDAGTAVLAARGRLLVVRRPADGLLGGLWAFPCAIGAEPRAAAVSLARTLGAAGTPAPPGKRTEAATSEPRTDKAPAEPPAVSAEPEPLGVIRHTFTHRRIDYHAFLFRVPGPPASRTGREADDPDRVWASAAELDALALPVAQRKIADLALERLAGS